VGAPVPDRRRFIVAPLVGGATVFGVLQIESEELPDKADLAFVDSMACQLAVAIRRHRGWQRDRRVEAAARLQLQSMHDREQRSNEVLRDAIVGRDHILQVVTHDLRNPLNAIQWIASLLLQKTPITSGEGDAERAKLETILWSAGRMARLIGDLADLASIQAQRLRVERQPCDAGQLVREAAASFEAIAGERRLGLRCELDDAPPAVVCDRDRISQIFSNLIGNAVQVSGAGGSIVLGARRLGDDTLFSVSDTGPGIRKEDLELIFERYRRGVTPGYEGTGLGLDIARGLVRAHGGTIWAESTIGVGSTFYFTIPAPVVAPRAAARAAPSVPDAEASTHVPHPILLVDDDADLREAMAELLGDQGFEVVTATGGREALRRLGDPAFRPCLILLDSSMPDMTGRAFLAEREKNPELAPIPIIVISGDHRLLQGSAASLHVDDCLLKPVPAELLIDSVRRHCSRDRPSPVAT